MDAFFALGCRVASLMAVIYSFMLYNEAATDGGGNYSKAAFWLIFATMASLHSYYHAYVAGCFLREEAQCEEDKCE